MLSPNHSYHKKWEGIFQQTLFPVLRPQEKDDVRQFAYIYCLTLQELRQLVEWTIDFRMWGKGSLSSLWRPLESQSSLQGRERKKWMLQQLKNLHAEAKKETVQFSLQKPKLSAGYKRSKIFVQKEYVDDKILGMCPVASEKTVCCNLRTLDAVKNCGFGCSYCSIQTMFTGDKVIFDEHLEEKLEKIQLDPHRSYHIGTGQSSDALLWGNQFRLLDALVRFAKKWPNVILEFKTKSKNIKYFLKNEVPSNIFCSWSLNPDEVILNEEHLTANLDERLKAASILVKKGMKVGFHLHPIVYFEGWREKYSEMIERLVKNFHPKDVVFVSFGTLTFPRPIIKKIRTYDIHSQVLKMPMVPNPEGKLTYPEEIKKEIFPFAYQQFSKWHKKVFFYLCMEERKYWHATFGKAYETNELFEQDMFHCVWPKLKGASSFPIQSIFSS